MPDGLAQVDVSELRGFLLAQLQWERYRRFRLILVHACALSGLLFWLDGFLRVAAAAVFCACFCGALFAGTMEWRWGRRRDRWQVQQ